MDRIVNEHFLKETKKEFAFEVDGIKYYQFTENGLPIYYMRLKAAQEVIAHASELKITESVFDEFQDVLDVYAGVKQGNQHNAEMTKEQLQAQLAHTNNMMRHRRKFGNNMDAMYYIASVLYFDETEDPAVYDRAYADKKIKIWLNDHQVCAFFLRSQLASSLISLEALENGSSTYFQNLYDTMYTVSINNLLTLSGTEISSEVGMNSILQAEIWSTLRILDEKGLLKSSNT